MHDRAEATNAAATATPAAACPDGGPCCCACAGRRTPARCACGRQAVNNPHRWPGSDRACQHHRAEKDRSRGVTMCMVNSAKTGQAALPPAARATPAFDPESDSYDYVTAKAAGMGPNGTGENSGHWGSVAEPTEQDRKKYGLPEESYMILKGKSHPTFEKAVAGEEARGFKVIKRGTRYFSVPSGFQE